MRFQIVIEKTRNNYSACVPDLPGCVSTGRTIRTTRRNIADAIAFHLDGLLADSLTTQFLKPKPKDKK